MELLGIIGIALVIAGIVIYLRKRPGGIKSIFVRGGSARGSDHSEIH